MKIISIKRELLRGSSPFDLRRPRVRGRFYFSSLFSFLLKDMLLTVISLKSGLNHQRARSHHQKPLAVKGIKPQCVKHEQGYERDGEDRPAYYMRATNPFSFFAFSACFFHFFFLPFFSYFFIDKGKILCSVPSPQLALDTASPAC